MTAANSVFEPVPSRISFPALEQDILEFWRRHEVFKRSVDERPEDRVFTFFEGPPTANGNPGIHHVLARVFKDLIPRYKTMQGYRVPRKGGWDTHGLPVELEVEKQLGLRSKPDIEVYGIEEFNKQCRESVFRYVEQWERMTERIGFWVDLDDAYVTYSRDYIETCWWIFRRLWDDDLMFRDYRVTPHCPRCETSLSSHEIALGYKEDTPDPSVTVMFRIPPELNPEASSSLHLDDGVPTYLLVWTTTPWTLSGNTALAVLPDAEYSLIDSHLPQAEPRPEGSAEDVPDDGDRCRVILATPRVEDVLRGEGDAVGTIEGKELVGLRYEPLYESTEWEGVTARVFVDGQTAAIDPAARIPARRVIGSSHVATDEGTGILHVAPAFGADDYEMGRSEGLLFLQPVTLSGTVVGGPGDGLFVKEADRVIRRDLRARRLLFADATIQHTYPFCWRCDTPVLYYAKPSWYIRTTAVQDRLIEGNQRIHWVPGHVKDGRFGEWLEGNIDWAVSRERYWGRRCRSGCARAASASTASARTPSCASAPARSRRSRTRTARTSTR
jgi:isoleucyl-tRNA synthetase